MTILRIACFSNIASNSSTLSSLLYTTKGGTAWHTSWQVSAAHQTYRIQMRHASKRQIKRLVLLTAIHLGYKLIEVIGVAVVVVDQQRLYLHPRLHRW